MTESAKPKTTPAKAKAKKKVAEPIATCQLAFSWGEKVRGVPNAALRSALFSINQRRVMVKKRTLLASVGGIEIRFKGERFNQTDLDVWEMLLHLSRDQPLGDRVEFSANAVLRGLGRGEGKAQHEQLKEEITRLRAGTVEIKWVEEGKTFVGGLVSKYFYDDVQERYVVIFDEDMMMLYDEGYTHVDWEQRKKLRQRSLAKWLHGFYSSHAEPLPYKVETIRDLCGSIPEQRLTDFRKLLRIALEQLKSNGSLISYEIDPKTDLLYVRRVPSMSQLRHIAKKITASGAKAFDSQ